MFRYISEYKPSLDSIKYLVFVACAFIPINALLWHISNVNDLGRSYVNVDYLAPFILSFLIFKFRFATLVFVVSYLLLYMVDIAQVILVKFGFEENVFKAAGNFGGFKMLDTVSSLYWGNILAELRQTPQLQYYIFLAGLVLAVIFAGMLLLKKSKITNFLTYISAAYLILTVLFQSDSVFLISLEIFLFLTFLFISNYSKLQYRISRSDLLVFVLVVYCFIFPGLKSNKAQDEIRNFYSNITTFVIFHFDIVGRDIDSASEELFGMVKTNEVKKYDNVFLIIIESLGALKNENSMNAILNVFTDKELLRNYDVVKKFVKFEGHTTTAEFRELCRWQMVGLPNITNQGEFDNCLPELMKKQGFHTVGIHNSSKYVLDRDEWWPLLGLDEFHFLQDLTIKYNYKNFCNGGKGFTAICEEDVIQKIIPDMMVRDKKNFVYFLTVQSHTPIDETIPSRPEYQKFCDKTDVLKDNKTACRIYDIQNNVFLSTIDLAKQLSSKRNMFILVGDHTPPFFKKDLNDIFRQDVIPMIIIKSKL